MPGLIPGATIHGKNVNIYFFEPADWLRNQLTSLCLNRIAYKFLTVKKLKLGNFTKNTINGFRLNI